MNKLMPPRLLLLAPIAVILSAILLPCSAVENLSGGFIRIFQTNEASDTVEGRFFHNTKNGTTLLKVIRPIKQLLRSSPEAFLVYYPESQRAFQYKGAKGQGLIDFMENFLAAVKNDFGSLLKGSRMVSSVPQGDTLHLSYESVQRNAKGPLVQIDIRKRMRQNREWVESVVVRTQDSDTVAHSAFLECESAGKIFYPRLSYLIKGPKSRREKTMFIVSGIRVDEKWRVDSTGLSLPASCKIEDF